MLGEKTQKINLLSKKEMEVFKMMVDYHELSAQSLANKLNIEIKTYLTHQTQIYKKLGVPKTVGNDEKRKWVVEQYAEALEVFLKSGVVIPEDEDPEIEITKTTPTPILKEDLLSTLNNSDNDLNEVQVPLNNRRLSIYRWLSVILGLLILSVIGLVIANQIMLNTPGEVLFEDQFPGHVADRWKTNKSEMVENGKLEDRKYELAQLSLYDTKWKNYIVYTHVVNDLCWKDNRNSLIGVRWNGVNYITASQWLPCDNTFQEWDLKITVQGNRYTVTKNGKDEPSVTFDESMKTGGLYIQLSTGAQLEYIKVVSLPD